MTIEELMAEFQSKGILSEVFGDARARITGIRAVEDCGPGDLVFADKKEYLSVMQIRKPSVVVTSPALREHFAQNSQWSVITAPNLGVAHALIKKKYASRDFTISGWSGVHPSSVMHETVILGEGTVIEPKAVVGRNSRIGKNCRIMAGVVIENDVTIGDETIIHPSVVIGYGCRIGNEVVIESGSVIGSQGYGFAQDKERKSYPIPQTGIVVIEDRVRVGANNCIDRAAYRETRIGAGTKLDNLCHVAHNVVIGQDCLLTAFLCVAGSTEIGSRVIASGQTGILDHVKICDDVVLLHRAGVSKDVDKPGAYGGAPLQPLNEYMRNAAAFRNVADLKKRVSELEKGLGPKT